MVTTVENVSPHYQEMNRRKPFMHEGPFDHHVREYRLFRLRQAAMKRAIAAGNNYLTWLYSEEAYREYRDRPRST